MRTVLVKNTVVALSCQLSVITIYWRLKYKLGYWFTSFFIRFKIKTLTLEFKTDPRKLSKT